MIDKYDNECCDNICPHEAQVNAVIQRMPPEDELFDLAELFKVFGDTTRIKILYVLFEEELCVCDIAEVLSFASCILPMLMSLSAISLSSFMMILFIAFTVSTGYLPMLVSPESNTAEVW